MNPGDISSFVSQELVTVRDARVVEHITGLRVAPRQEERRWDYGAPDSFTCWVVLEHVPSNTAIVYCQEGFGPKAPWGLVAAHGTTAEMSMGMDSNWFPSFIATYFESVVATELPIWRVFRRTSDAYPGDPITDESDWESTWERVEELRASDPSAVYECSHSVRFGSSE